MGTLLDMVNTVLQYSIDMFANNSDHLKEVEEIEEKIDGKEREYLQSHIDRMTRNECTPEAGMLYSDVIAGLERVADHATNIAYAAALQS